MTAAEYSLPLPPVPTPEVRAIRAAAVWDLVLAKHLRHDSPSLTIYAKAVGCTQEDILVQRRARPHPGTEGASRAASHVRARNAAKGTRRCAMCEKTLPVSAFSKKQPQLDVLRSYCDDCYKAYQRGRYESDDKRAAMTAAGVRFAMRHDGSVALECTGCKQPLVRGDRMIVHGEVFHARCAP